MVKGVTERTDIQSALRELVLQLHLHSSMIHPAYVGDFLAFLVTRDSRCIDIWRNTLRDRYRCTMMDGLEIQEIDDLLESMFDE